MNSRPVTSHTSSPQVGVAACAIDTQAALGGSAQIFPMGVFDAPHGSLSGNGPWKMTPGIGTRLAAELATRRADLAFDYDHQTLHAKENGKPAPAAGWFRTLEVRDDGVWATNIQWTAAARQMIEAGEYRYTSPVFAYDRTTGEVLSLFNVALTNTPALEGMAALAACTTPVLSLPPSTENLMDKLLERLRKLLNLPVTATAEEIAEHLDKLKSTIGESATAAASFSLTDHVAALSRDLETTRTALAAANTAAATGTPDPAKFVPMDQFVAMQNQVAVLSRQYEDKERNELIEQALADGRILPAQKDYWASQPVAALSAYLKVAQPIAALSRMQSSDGAGARASGAAGSLSADQLKIARNLGVDPEKLAQSIASRA